MVLFDFLEQLRNVLLKIINVFHTYLDIFFCFCRFLPYLLHFSFQGVHAIAYLDNLRYQLRLDHLLLLDDHAILFVDYELHGSPHALWQSPAALLLLGALGGVARGTAGLLCFRDLTLALSLVILPMPASSTSPTATLPLPTGILPLRLRDSLQR